LTKFNQIDSNVVNFNKMPHETVLGYWICGRYVEFPHSSVPIYSCRNIFSKSRSLF